MKSNSTHIANAVRECIGRRLLSCNGLYFVSNDGARETVPDSVQFLFLNKSLVVSPDSDGWLIKCMLEGDIKPIGMGDSGNMSVFDLSDEMFFSQAIGRRLSACEAIESPKIGHVMGIKFIFGGYVEFMIFTWGDELRISDKMPNDADMKEIFFNTINARR